MTEREHQSPEPRELSEVRKSMDTFLVSDPVPVEAPLVTTMDAAGPGSEAPTPSTSTPQTPTDFDG